MWLWVDKWNVLNVDVNLKMILCLSSVFLDSTYNLEVALYDLINYAKNWI